MKEQRLVFIEYPGEIIEKINSGWHIVQISAGTTPACTKGGCWVLLEKEE